MGRMSEVQYDVVARLRGRKHPQDIAEEFNIPVSWVYAVQGDDRQELDGSQIEDYSPHNTSNS